MSKQSRESKRSGSSKGVAFNPTGQRNVSGRFTRSALIKLYGYIALLVLTFGLIAILEFAQRSLPNASKSHFDPFQTGTSSSQSTALQTQASTKTNLVTLTKRDPWPQPTLDKRQSPEAAAGNQPNSTSSAASESSSSSPLPSSSPPPVSSSTPPPSSSSPISSSASASPVDTIPVELGGAAVPVSAISVTPTSSNSTSASPTTNSTTVISTPASNSTDPTSASNSTVGGTTDVFVPTAVTSTVGPAACTATAASSLQCTCPTNSEVSNCACTPDPTASICQCVIKVDASGADFQDCVCPPDTCTTCEAPVDSLGGSSQLGLAACPPIPYQAGCNCFVLDVSQTNCSSVVQCDCGDTVRAAQCVNSTTTAPTVGVVQNGTVVASNSTNSTVAPILPPVTNATTILPVANSTLISSSSSPIVPIVSSSIVSPTPVVPIVSLSTSSGPSGPTVIPVTVTPSPSSVVAKPVVSSPTPPKSVVSNPVVPIVSLSTSSGPSGLVAIPVTITPSPSSVVAAPVAANPAASNSPSNSPSVSVNAQGQTVVVSTPAVSARPVPVISQSVGTNSLGQPTTVPVTLPPISLSIGTNSLGQSTTVPITLSPSSTLPTGVVFFVSNSIATKDGSTSLVAVTFLGAQANPSLSVVTAPSGQVFTIPTALLQTEALTPIPSAIAPSQTPGTGKSGGGGGGDSSSTSKTDQVAVLTWPKAKTFLGGYVPVLSAKLYQMGWTAIHNQARDMAPFNAPSIGTLFGGPDAMSLVALVPYLASWVIIPLAADSIFFDTNYGCANPNPLTPENPCWPPKMTTNTWVIRTLQGFLSVTAAVAVALIAMWFKKPHGASNDPTSIAAIAAIASHPEVVRDFSCPAGMTTSALKQRVKKKKYDLNEFQTSDGTTRYGMVPSAQPPGSAPAQDNEAAASSTWGIFFSAGWKTKALFKDTVYLLYLFLILGITAAYLRDINKSVFAKMFQGSTFGRRIIFAILAAIASTYFSQIERDMQTLTPYMDLQHLNERPTPTILLRKHTLPLTSFLPMLRNRHFVSAIVAFVAILSEFLIVTLSGLPYRPGQLRSEFFFCAISSLVILALMLGIIVVVNIWRRFLPHLPQKPDSVANVLSYVVGARMCEDFVGLEKVKVSERDKAIRALGKRYGYGKRAEVGANRETVERWIIDEGAVSEEVETGRAPNTTLNKSPGVGVMRGGSQLAQELYR